MEECRTNKISKTRENRIIYKLLSPTKKMNSFRGEEYPSHFKFSVSEEERLFVGQVVGSATLKIKGKDGYLPIPEQELIWTGDSIETRVRGRQ